MLVFGDHREVADPSERLRQLAAVSADVAQMDPGIRRHAALVSLLIEAGRLVQGVADSAFDPAIGDSDGGPQVQLSGWLSHLALAVIISWNSGCKALPELPPPPACPALPRQVEMRLPEGYAFYALYPEAYAEAARDLRLSAPPRVIGIRSIGTSLAAIVAARIGAPPPISVRPFGDSFARRIAIAPDLERDLLADAFHFVIVDEGPGLSGSSFGAVADWLEQRGVPPDRIAFMPSHDGPLGPQSGEAHRRRWDLAQRCPADFGTRLPELLGRWLPSLIGPLDGPLLDMSGGKWRRLRFPGATDWPAAAVASERRKFLASANGRQWLVKFAGLGRVGEGKLAIARALAAAGLTPEPLGLIHGFIVEEWHADARSLGETELPLSQIARYIGARATLLPAPHASGASMAELLVMMRRNVGLGLGEQASAMLDPWADRVEALEAQVIRVRTDNRLDRHEWLLRPDGALLKSDAVDHTQAHDLIGCQDLAWDVAGAASEFGLDQHALELLLDLVGQASGRPVDRQMLDFLRPAYCAFRLGEATLAAQAAGSEEARRLERSADRYAGQLKHLLRQYQQLDSA